jgi:hypothetical protein
VAANRLGLIRRPRAADVVAFYAAIERLNFAARAMSNEPENKVYYPSYLVLIGLIEDACRKSLPLLAQLPFDVGDANLRAKIKAIDADDIKLGSERAARLWRPSD